MSLIPTFMPMVHATLAQVGAGALFTAGGLAAAGAAAVAIPVAIHLLTRMRRKPEPWAAMRFLIEAYRKQRRRLQMEQWLLLLVRCLIVALLGLALAGPLLTADTLGLPGQSGRVLYLLIDDSLASQSTRVSVSRFDRQKQAALKLIAELDQDDRVAVGLAGRPTRWLVPPLSDDLSGAKEAIEKLQPRFSASDWPALLSEVAEKIPDQRADHGKTHVVLLSGFTRAGVDPDQPLPGTLSTIGQSGRIWFMPVSAGGVNIQVAEVKPFRRTLFSGDPTGASLPVELRLHRMGSDLPAGSHPLRVALSVPGQTAPSVTADRTVTWFPGQTQAGVTLDLDLAKDPTPGARFITAQIEAGSGDDLIKADNINRSLLLIKSRPVALIVDAPTAPITPGASNQLPARQWLSLALSPAPGYGIDSQVIDGQALTEEALARADAVYILRPDLLTQQGYARLLAFAKAGGLVVVFPPDSTDPGTWGPRLTDGFGLDWRISPEPTQHPDFAQRDAGWPLNLTDPAPAAVRLLAADWPELLRPVRVRRYIPVEAPNTQAVRWVRIDLPGSPPLLLHQPVGQGALLLWTVPPALTWSNLPSRPGFLPIIQETMRGLLASLPGSGELIDTSSGDLTALGSSWAGVTQLRPAVDPAFERDPVSGQSSITLRPTDAGPVLSAPLDTPGVYQAVVQGKPAENRYIAVDPVFAAGDTRPTTRQQVQAWAKPMGPGEFFDIDNPGLIFESADARVNLGWPLLWVVLALMLIEAFLARAFSHASASANIMGSQAGNTAGNSGVGRFGASAGMSGMAGSGFQSGDAGQPVRTTQQMQNTSDGGPVR